MDHVKYPKINTIYKRENGNDKEGNPLIIGDYATDCFEYLKDVKWNAEEKIDGTNIGVRFDGETVEFQGRTEKAQMIPELLERLKELFPVEKLKETFNKLEPGVQVVLYGEGFGRKIQKSGSAYIKNGVDFILFDVKVGHWWLKRDKVEEIAASLGIRCVKLVGQLTFDEAIEMVKKGFVSYESEDRTLLAEGLVLKCPIGLLDRSGQRLITKIKRRDFKNIT